MAAITAEQRAELVALFLTMFGQAPTTTQLARMVTARENGTSLLNIATSASVILESDFALVASMDAESFATYLTNALLASDIPASARTWATNWVITNVSGNKSKVQVIVEAVQAIRATTNTNYASSKAELAADVTAILTDINNPPVEVKTLTLTSNADTGAAFTGAGSDDVFVGQISGDLGLGTTFTAGDVLNGSSGVDTVNITVAGASTAAVTSTAVTLNNVEKVLVQNFDSNTDDTEDNEFNAALWTGVTTVGLSASTSTGDTSFTNLKNIVAAEMKNGNADLSVSYIAGVGAGTADTQTLALDGTTGGTFTASSAIETIAITATGASNTLAALAGTGANKLTINTAGALTITGALPTNIKTIDTSASAGGTSLVVGTADLTITGGAGNDSLRIDGATIDTNDTIDAGAGTDTLTLSGSIASAANGARVVNFENLRSYQDVTAADARTQDVSFISGITSVGVSKMTYTDDEDNTDDDVTVSSTFTNMAAGQTMVISGVSTATSDTNSTADQGDLTANVTFSLAADTTADSGTLTLGSVVGGAVSAATNQTITLNVTANDYETLTVVSNGASTSSNTIGTLTAGDATTLNITANRALTITTLTAAAVKNVDASASTANVTISSALSLASTIQGGAGNDTFTGSGLADSLNGGAGNDTLSAGVGNDTVDGGAGNDQITGGTGSDKLYGGAGNDTFTDATDGSDYAEGGDGDDTFVTSLANLTNADTIIGGAGTDTISINDAASVDLTADIIKLQNVSGVEVIGFSALNGSDTVTINDGVVSTAGGSLTLKFLTGVTGANTINASGVLASVSTVSFTDLAGLSTTYSIGNGKDNVSMGDAADTIVVSNTAYLAGTDSLDAGTGSDTLSFTNDTAATNTITVAQLAGVKGAETFSIDHATDTNLVNYAFTLDDATVGNQVAVGGTFTITRDAAEDGTLKVDGSAVTNSYALSLAGEDGNDTLTGGAGNDTISGRDGNDSLTGGGGNDVFVVTGLTQAANGSDTVTDFNFGTASTAVDTIQIDVTSTTKVFGRASTGITAAAGTEILILDQAAYQDASGAQSAAQTAFGANDNAAEAIVIWQDTLGNLNLSVYADASADATANGTLQTSMVRFSGLTLAGVQTLIDASDFTLI